ncbi:AraC-like DNA-binding protein/mannose-6-phosphate isomerase-like protein (cupin superfamily) [Paenibacillus phyllosphaerae]|uniref:AraC-like DNA-binding protein/mannose-6-phosphate isomerase-like protein (Cupin superfamily) n=1 Tax=Paenibacillus phyllosphaerae TaxID=274593 RepID=A0A7W5FNR8_9BACL|nr:AraC family transcriptional regulator [Paenibacillus phyllosphaerae]MBB3111299.1 AraC-like DNA-binding protein/mannose-6-phosphate isomerase-like protein (cupin superfamily) [Paenibacillus phyllosphaerae]
MNPIYRTFPIDEKFPFHLVYHATKQLKDEMPDHMHDWYEIVYIYNGKGTFFIDQTFYEMRPGDLFFLPPNVIHRAFPDESNPTTTTAVFFSPKFIRTEGEDETLSPLHVFQQAREKNRFRMPLNKTIRDLATSALDTFHAELRDNRDGHVQIVRYALLLLLLQLSRETEHAVTKPDPNPALAPQWLRDTLAYIDQHPRNDLQLSALCKLVAVSPSHFSRTFRQSVGMTITDYVVAKRLMLAKDRLLATDDHIQQIAQECGFESLTYFHKKFKEHTGHSPLVYRRLHAE